MSYLGGGHDILVLPEALQAFAWSAPMRELAAKVGMSDVGLKKLLAGRGVAPPPQGYWNKIAAGRPAPVCPQVRPRRPGETGRIRLDARFATILSPARPIASSGPFASELVPESLERLYEQELQAIGRASVPKSLERPHPGLVPILNQEKRRAEKFKERGWAWDAPKFDTPLGRRRLRLLNGLLLTLASRGHGGDAFERDGDFHARAFVGETYVGIEIAAAGKCRMVQASGGPRPVPDLPASTPLCLSIRPDFDGRASQSWQDDASGRLEGKMASIAAGAIVTGEAQFRRGLREAEERVERERARREDLRQRGLAKRNEERLQNLHASGELLRKASEIRALVERVRVAIQGGELPVDQTDLSDWEQWALSEADRVDPVLSGQVLTHLRASGG